MPIEFTPMKTSSGADYLRCRCHDLVSKDDVSGFLDMARKGGSYDRMPLLVIIESGAIYPPETRKVLSTASDIIPVETPLAIVTSNTVMRWMFQFIDKANQIRTGRINLVRYFANEAGGRAWLDQHLAGAKAPPPMAAKPQGSAASDRA